MALPELIVPASLNYIGLFLTLECNLNCSYCINDPLQAGRRSVLFPIAQRTVRKEMSPEQWIAGLSRLPLPPDLPITLQGGEPMLYGGGKGLGQILAGVSHSFDLLTNFALKPEVFVRNLNGQQAKLQRAAPYPSIRVSYHADEMNRVWSGGGFSELVERCLALGQYGFRVSPDKAQSDVGIYMVEHPQNRVSDEMRDLVAGRLPFEGKEFLGVYQGALYGHYLYPFSTDLIARGFASQTLRCECQTSELLIDPLGFIWGCHFFLYESWSHGGPGLAFAALEQQDFRFKRCASDLFSGMSWAPIGHLLDPEFALEDLAVYRPCSFYGRCVGCDTKIKNDRFQNYYDRGVAHTSVSIRNIEMPEEIYAQVEDKAACRPFISRLSLNEEGKA